MELQALLELLERTLKYTPIVYTQTSSSQEEREAGTSFVLEYKHTSLPDDGLLFFLPLFNCKEDATLTVKLPQSAVGNRQYVPKTYTIEVEANNSTTRRTLEGDIIAYRLCIFRFKPNTNKIVLINSPLFMDAKYTNLTVTNATFLNPPKVFSNDNLYALVDARDFEALKNRVERLENKIIYGNIDAEEALADRESGTIYIKIED